MFKFKRKFIGIFMMLLMALNLLATGSVFANEHDETELIAETFDGVGDVRLHMDFFTAEDPIDDLLARLEISVEDAVTMMVVEDAAEEISEKDEISLSTEEVEGGTNVEFEIRFTMESDDPETMATELLDRLAELDEDSLNDILEVIVPEEEVEFLAYFKDGRSEVNFMMEFDTLEDPVEDLLSRLELTEEDLLELINFEETEDDIEESDDMTLTTEETDDGEHVIFMWNFSMEGEDEETIVTELLERLAELDAEGLEDILEVIGGEEDDNGDDDDDDDDDDDSDDSDDDSETSFENIAGQKIEQAMKKIALSEEILDKKESQGKDVSLARENLETAKEMLEEAISAYEAGDYAEARELATEAKHIANLAKGKDVRSSSAEAQIARNLGDCLRGSEHKGKKSEEFKDCFDDFDEDVDEQTEDDMDDEDQENDQLIEDYLNELLEEVDEALVPILEEFVEFNFSGLDDDDVIEKIDEILNNDKDTDGKIEDLEDLLNELEEESNEDKYENDVIPFSDTGDQEWFYYFVNFLENEGCVSGFTDEMGNPTGLFKPGNKVVFGESLKFVMQCILDEDPSELSAGDFWARGYALGILEEFEDYLNQGILRKIQNALNDDAAFITELSRAELIQMIIDILGIDIPEATESPFVDVSLSHPNVDAIVYAYEMGVISGDSETDTFRPDEVPNRAEVAKIIVLAKELL